MKLVYVLVAFGILKIVTAGYWRKSYDYIIVGGGGAGCVLARRLSENPNVTVLLLEAGPDDKDDPFVPIPRTFLSVIHNPKYEWEFFTEPQPHLSRNRSLGISQGKILGGCTSHNGMNVVRGSKHDYDRWAAIGNKGWSYKEVLPYFIKAEDMTDATFLDKEYHGTGGPLVTRMTTESELIQTYIKAGEELGYKEVDYNAETQYGFARIQNSINRRGERMSTSRAYLRPVMMRRNLDVVLEAHVLKIVMTDGAVPRARGVIFQKDSKKEYIKANREVIVSAGAINSPKLLMLSGIGPKKHLEEHKIKVIADLPVGDGLEDHIAVHFAFWFKQKPLIKISRTHTFEALFEYLFAGTGPWSTMSSEGISFFRSDLQPKDEKMPYLEVPVAINVWGLNEQLAQNIREGKGLIKHMVQALEESEAGNLGVGISSASILYHPRNRGYVRLRNTDPYTKPIIVKNYFENEDDIKDMIQGVRIAQKIANTKVMQNAGVEPLTKYNSNCIDHQNDSDEFWRCIIIHEAMSFAHFTGTCRMAPDKTGVLDERLRVKNVSGLRVVDTSIMPYIISGHAMAPTIMIAEKASDMIKEDAMRK